MTLRDQYPLHRNKVYKKTAETIALLLPLLFIGLISMLISAAISLLFLALFILACLFIVWWSREYFRTYHYDLSENGLEIQKGVFFPHSITIPDEKVSDVYVDRDVLDRLFGLYDLHFSSASISSGNLSHIDGIDERVMEALRARLMGTLNRENQGANMAAHPGAQSAQPSSHAAKGTPPPTSSAPLAVFKPAPVGYYIETIYTFLGLLLVCAYLSPLIIPYAIIPVFIFSVIWVRLEYDVRRYEVRSEGVYIRQGWLMPSETLLFYKNIQDVDVVEPLLARLVGLQNVSIKSMSLQSARVAKLAYLSSVDANGMQKMLHEQIGLIRQTPADMQRQKAGLSRSPTTGPSVADTAHYSGQLQSSHYPNHFFLGRLLEAAYIGLIILFGLIVLALLTPFVNGAAGWLLSALALSLMVITASVILFSILALIDGATYSYSLQADGLAIALGFINRYKKVIRYEKVQDIQLHVGFVESFFHLASVHVETGSRDLVQEGRGQGSAAGLVPTERIPYLKLADANALRAELLGITRITYPKSEKPLRTLKPLSPLKPLKKTIAYFGLLWAQLMLISILTGLLLPAPFNSVAFGAGALLLALALFGAPIAYAYETYYLKRYFYDENGQTLVIRKGVFGWNEIVIPLRNIQSIYVDQDWYDVYFDLWDVWVISVTQSSGPMAHIDGLGREDAQALVRLLAERVEKARRGGI